MKKNTNSIVLNQITYDAVMSMLTSKNGVDISPILNDLQGYNPSAAINAGLLLHGKKLELPYDTAYSVGYDGDITEYHVESVSFITNYIGGKTKILRKNAETNSYDELHERDFTCPIEDFLQYEPLFEVVRAESDEKLAKKND